MSSSNYTKSFLSAAIPTLALLAAPVWATDSEGLPKVSIERGQLTSAATHGVNRIYQAKKGFTGYSESLTIAESLFSESGAKVDVNLEFNDSGSALLFVSGKDSTAFFRVDTGTGDFSFNKGMADYMEPNHTSGLPGKDEAVDLAVSYLERLDLMPKDKDQLIVQAVGGTSMGSQDEKGNVEHFEKLRSVHFGRQIDGIDVGGPGSKIVVQLGRGGELVGLHRRWSELREVSGVSAKSFLGASEVTERAVQHLQREWHEAAKISSAAPEPGYFDDGKGRIEPAYFIQAEIQYDPEIHGFAQQDGEPKRYLGVISALRYSGADLRQLQPARKAPGYGSAFEGAKKRDQSDD